MANGRAKIATQSTSTSWLNNAIKSIGLSAKNVLQKEYAPNLYEAVSSGAKTSKSIVTTLRRNAAANNRVQNQLANNKYVKYAQTAYKNALYDLRTGNFNNEERANKEFESSLGLGELEDAFGDDFSFGDDGADVDVNIIGSPVSQDNSAMFALTDQVRKGTEATLKTSQANMNAMIAMNSASMMQIQTLSTQVIGELNSINQNISAMIEFNNTSMNKFIQSSLAFYERMGTRFDSGDSYGKSEKLTADQVMNNNKGGINFSTYKDYIKQNFKSVTSEGTLGMLKGILDSDEMIQMAISNPLGFATEGIIKYMMPKLVTNTIQSAEAAFSSFLPMLLHRVGEWGEEQATGMFGKVKQVIGKIFGLHISEKDRTDKFDVAATIEKGAVPFDGITRHAIVEVITKELREQTAYLRAIAARQGIHVDKVLKSTDVFSYKTGTYLKPEEITSKILDEIRNSTVNGVMGGSFGKALRGAATTSADEDTQKKLNAMIDELAVLLEKNRAGTVLRDKDAFTNQDSRLNKIMGQLSGASDLKKLLSEVLQDMVKNNPSSANDLARSVLSASMDRNKMIKYIQDNPLEYSLYAANLGGKDLDELILKRMRSTGTGPALKNGETIQSLLGNYQTSHPKQESPFANFSNWVNSPSSKNDGGEAFFKKLLSDTKNGVHGVIDGIMSGDSDKALKSIFNVFSNQFKGIWESFDKNFLTPIKQTLFGTKDENGYSREGIFSGVSNSFKDAGHMLVYHITGKGYRASNGTVIADKTDDEETVVGNFKKIAATIGTGLKEKFSGIAGKVKDRYKPKLTDEEDENEEGIDAAEKRKRRLRNKFRNVYKSDSKNEMFYDKNGKLKATFKKGGEYEIFEKEKESALGFLKNSLKEGFIGWQEAFFGKELSEDEKEHLKDTMVKELNARLPSSITGSAVGAGVGMMSGGSLLGWLVGGPIGGAAIGTAVGFASKSEKFQEFLFGKKDEAGNRLGGLISKKVQDYVKENKTALAAGGALGAVQGALGFGLIGKLSGGLLGNLVGGPVLGSILGMATGMAVKSHMFHEFLFGDPDTGQKGIIASFNSVIKKIRGQDSGDDLTNGGKLFGMNMIGAGGGALTAAIIGKLGILGASLSPVGVIGGALVGLGLAIRAQKDNFHTWLFGEKDENGNKVKEGVLGQFKNMLIVNVIHPLKNTALDIFAEAKYNLGFALDSIRFAVEPITNGLIGIGKGIKNAVTGWINKAGEAFKDNIITPLGDLIFKPIASAISGVTKAMWKMTSRVVMLPFKLLDRVVGIITGGIGKGIKKVGEIIHDKVIKPITKFVETVTGGIGKAIKGILKWVVKKPLEFIGGIGTYIADKFTGVGGENRKKGIVGRILDSTREQRKVRKEQRKVDLFNMRKEARERRIRTKNEQMIAKATGNQKYEDTEENRKLARNAGFKINSRIEAVKSKEEVDRAKIIGTVDQVHGEEAKQTNILTQILQKVGIISDNTENGKTSGNGGRRKRGKKRKGSNNDQTSNSSESTGTNEETQTDGQQNEDNVVWYDGKNHSNDKKLDGTAKVAQDIHNAGGIGKYIKTNVTDFFSGAKEGYKNSWLKGKVDKAKGLFSKFKGKGFAEGTLSTPDDEAYVVGEDGPELMTGANRTVIPHDILSQVFEDYRSRKKQRRIDRRKVEMDRMSRGLPVFIQGAHPGIFTSILGGLKRFLIDRPLGVIRGAKNAIKGYFATKQAVDSYVDSSDVMGDSQIMLEAQTLGGSDNPDEFGNGDGGGASLAGIAASVEASHSADGDSEASQEAEEDDKRNILQRGLSFLKQKFAAKKGLSSEELKEQEAKRKERKDIAIIGKNTGEQVKSQNKFTDLWSSIFSKKGLITAGLILAAPLIINLISGICKFFGSDFGQFIQHILGSIGNTVGWAVQSLARLFTNGGLGDGKNIGDTIGETANRFADLNPFGEKDYYNDGAGTFGILNEDGRIDRFSAPMAKGLVKAGAKTTGTVVGAATKGVTYFRAGKELLKTGGISKATQETLKNFSGKKLSKIGSEAMIEGGKKTATKNFKSLFGIGSKTATKEAVEGATKAATKEVVEGAAEGGTKLATTALKEGNKGLLSKVIGYVKDFFSKVLGKAEGFAAKHSSKGISKGLFKTLGEKVTQWLTKNFGKVGAKISEFLATTAGLAVTVVGWLVKEGTWVLLGALDGLTGARKLFHIDDEPDWKMKAIATLLGAFGGTTIGCIMDIINGAICSATGLDIYCEVATLIYNCISSQEDQLKLRESREKFETEYYAWAEDQMRNQYKTMKKYGLLKDPNMTEDDYVAAVKAGEEDAAYMGIQEYNVEKHKSMYDHVINGVTTVATKVGFFSGFDKDYVKYDAQGNKYTNNHDGTWTVNGNENEKISEDTVKRMDEEGKITKTEEQYQGFLQRLGDGLGKGIFNIGKGIGDAWNATFHNKKGSAFVLPDGSYYDLNGNHYDAKHHLIKAKEKTLDELLKMKFIMQDGSYYDDEGNHYDNKGNLIAEKEKTLEELQKENADRMVNLEKDFEIQKSGFSQIISDFCDSWKSGFDTIINSIKSAIDRWNEFWQDRGKNLYEGIGFLTGENKDSSGKSFGDYWWDGFHKLFHFAKGTENAPKDEVAMVGEEGPELMVMKGGEKVYANSKPLQVVLTGADKEVANAMSQSNININVNNTSNSNPSIDTDKIIETSNYYKKLINSYDKYSKEKIYERYYNTNETINKLFKNIENDGYIGASGNIPELSNRKVWFDPQGNYYKKTGNKYNYYNANGDIIKEDVPIKEFEDKLNASLLHADDEPQMKIGAKKAVSTVKSVISSTWDKAKNIVENGWNTFNKWLSKISGGSGNIIPGGSGSNSRTTSKLRTIGNFTDNDYGYSSFNGILPNINKTDAWLSKTGGSGTNLKYYSQDDSRWKNLAYGNDGATMSDTGCGPTSMAMVASSITHKNVRPDELAALAQYTGMRDETGTNANFINIASSLYGITANEVLTPTESRLRDSISQGPTILLGTNGIGNNPYTSSGHYVVADGYSNGYVNIKDPRGRGYNKKYKLKDIAKNTNAAWVFSGNNGPSKTKYKLSRGGRGMSKSREAWVNLIKAIKKLYSEYGYYSAELVPITYNGRTLNCRLDCSGYVSACLCFNGTIKENQQPSCIYARTGTGHSNSFGMDTDTDFDHFIWDGNLDKLQPGDIMSNTEHTQIYAGMINGEPYVYSVGDDWQCAQPGPTRWWNTGGYTDFWSPEHAKCRLSNGSTIKSTSSGSRDTNSSGTGLHRDASYTNIGDNVLNFIDSTTSSTSDNLNNVSGNNDSNTNTPVFDTLKNFISQFTSKTINGLISGNWDTNYDLNNTTNNNSISSNIGSSDSDGTGSHRYTSYNTGVLRGDTNGEKIYSYLINNGLNPIAASGIIGNFMRESGLKPNNVGDDINKNLGIDDAEFTKRVDTGKISKNEFMNASWGDYGTAWGYGLAQWTMPDGKGRIYDSAKDKHVSIGDLANQLDLTMDEMKTYSDLGVTRGTFINELNKKSTPEEAARFFHDNLERSADTEASLVSGRLKFARDAYNMYKDLDISSLSENTSDISNTASLIKINGEYYFVGANGNKVKAAKWMIPNGGSGQGYSNPARIKSIRPYKRSYKRGGYGNTSVYLSSISSFKPANIKHITNTSTDISTAISYIIGYLEAITNNTAGANDKLTALRNLSNSNQIYVGTTNNNINGKPTKSTTVVKSSNNGQINDSISRGMQIAQKIAKG